MRYRFTLSGNSQSQVINEPDGWKDATLKLARKDPESDLDFSSLVEFFEGSFIFYGSNGVVDGGKNFIDSVVDALGVDAQIEITIELAMDDINYETVFTGQIATPELVQMPDNKLQGNIIKDDFWTKFIKRLETPVDLQSPTSIDGDSLTVQDSVNVNLTPQRLIEAFYGYHDIGYRVIDGSYNGKYIPYDVFFVEIDEVENKYTLPVVTNTELPVWIFDAKYEGVYTFDIRLETSVYEGIGGGVNSMLDGSDRLMQVYIKKNNETPVAFTITDYSGDSTVYSYLDDLDLVVGDSIRIYMEWDFEIPGLATTLLIWGKTNTNILNASDDPLLTPIPSGSDNPSYLRITANTTYPATNSEGFFLHDVFAAIIARITGREDSFFSAILGSLQTLYRQYEESGCYWHLVLIKGLQLRLYSLLEKPFFLDFKTCWNGANPILNLGLGYELYDENEVTPTVNDFDEATNTGSGTDWSLSHTGHTVTLSVLAQSKRLTWVISNGILGATYEIGYDVTTSALATIQIRIWDESFTFFEQQSITPNGNATGTASLTPSFVPRYLTFVGIGPLGGADFEVDPFTFTVTDIPDVEPDKVIRIEDKAHFYDDSYTSLIISNVRDIQVSYDADYHFNLVRIGYNKWESEAVSGIDDPQTKRQYATLFKMAGKSVDLYSSFIAAGLTIENTRRQTKEKSADYKYDNDTFIISVNPDPIEISPETSPDVTDYEPELDENFDSISGLQNSDTRYNSRLTPARNLIRWLNYLSGCLFKNLSSFFTFQSGEGNYDMTSELTEVSPVCYNSFDEVSESGNIAPQSEVLFIPKLIEMEVPFTWENWQEVVAYRKNPIAISQTTEDYTQVFIKELDFKPAIGKAVIKGWPKTDFNLIVPEDEFLGLQCTVQSLNVLLTEGYEFILTESGFNILLE